MPGAISAEPFRRRLFDALERSRRNDALGRLVDGVIIALILGDVFALVVDTVPSVHATWGRAIAWLDTGCVLVFIVEYAARLWTAPEHPALSGMPDWRARLVHAARPIMLLDLAVLLPFFLAPVLGPDIAVVRILRIARFYRLARYSPVLTTIVEVIGAEWRALAGCALLFAGLILLAGAAMFLAEGTVQPDRLGDIPSAMWWAVVTLSTVGYGDVVPLTAAGRVVAGLTMIFGIIFFALPVGVVATSFQQQIRRRDFVVSFAMVARVPLFARLDPASVARLVGILTARRVAPNDVIIQNGEEADAMYFIASGEVAVETPAGPVLLSEGDFFGEIALVSEDARRTATVVAVRTSELLVLGARDFRHLTRLHPEIVEAVQEVARQRTGPPRQPASTAS